MKGGRREGTEWAYICASAHFHLGDTVLIGLLLNDIAAKMMKSHLI